MLDFRGLSAFPITPADDEGRVDTVALRALLRRLIPAGVQSIGLLGSTGSYPYIGRAERRKAIEAAVEEIGGSVPLLVGIGALRTSDAVHFARDARAAGADGLLLAPMSYLPLTEAEVFSHFEVVAAATDLPLCIYNNPTTTHFSFSTNLLARLSHVPNIVAAKNPAPADKDFAAEIATIRKDALSGFSLGYSGDVTATAAMISGAAAWYSVIGGVFPGICVDIVTAAQSGDHAKARALDLRLKPLWALFAEYTSFRVVYAAVNILGICEALPPRPILPLSDSVQRRIASVLRDLDLR